MASTDDAETSKEFAHKNGANFPILSDPDGTTAEKYGVLTFGSFASRQTFVIDKTGKVIHIDRDVNPITAGPDLGRFLETLKKKP